MISACGMDDQTSWSPTPGMTMLYETEVSWPDERWTVLECGIYEGRDACRVLIENIYETLGADPIHDVWISKTADGDWIQYDDRFGNGWDWPAMWAFPVASPFVTDPLMDGEAVDFVETAAGTFYGCVRSTSDWSYNPRDSSWERSIDLVCPGVGRVKREIEDSDPAYSLASMELVEFQPSGT